jgi:hypothetical protein
VSNSGGRSYREILVAFYQKYNAAKLSDVDNVLTKYKGQEENLFRKLAEKYLVDPALFGVSQAAPPAPAFGSGFGQPSPLGGGPSMASPFGTVAPTVPASNPPSGGGFAQFAAGPSSGFSGGGAAAAGGGFGSLAQSAGTGFGGAGFAPGPSPFGTATPFGAPRR